MADKRITQKITIWLLPLILIGGLFLKPLGYLVFFMIIFFLTLSYFKGRLWCAHLCPRGAFLDLVLERFSLKRRIPKVFLKQKVKWTFFTLFMAFFAFLLVISPKDLNSIGFVFVRMCILTTIIAILLGIPLKARAWCALCPMGTLQSKIGSLKKVKTKMLTDK
jgi:polyferredoxin